MLSGFDLSLLKPCPVCGKRPEIRIHDILPGGGAFCTVSCKPWFRKPHRSVCHGKASPERAIAYAIADWNGEEVPDGFR